MGILSLLESAAQAGLRIERFGERRLRVHGPASAGPEALELGRHKDAILDALELYEERAALMEYEGGLSRDEAETQARAAIYRMIDTQSKTGSLECESQIYGEAS